MSTWDLGYRWIGEVMEFQTANQLAQASLRMKAQGSNVKGVGRRARRMEKGVLHDTKADLPRSSSYWGGKVAAMVFMGRNPCIGLWAMI